MKIEEKSNSMRNVAWFNLSQLVDRREKEKALNLYKLLSYSFDNDAYALQVEADLLEAFGDELATEKFKQAAHLYKQDRKNFAAASVYEHLCDIDTSNLEYLQNVISAYAKLDWKKKVQEYLTRALVLRDEEVVPPAALRGMLSTMLGVLKETKEKKAIKVIFEVLSDLDAKLADECKKQT